MSAKEELIERVRTLTEEQAKTLLEWMEQEFGAAKAVETPAGVFAAKGWSKKYNLPYKTTAEYMRAIREGEEGFSSWAGPTGAGAEQIPWSPNRKLFLKSSNRI